MSIDDLTIETSNGEVTEFGIRDLWYEVTWENIVDNELTYGYYFDSPITANYSATLETITFDVSPDGTFSHGYGDQFADKYDTDFGDVESIDVPFSTSGAWVQDTLDLDDDEDENTVEGVAFRIDIYADTTSGPIHSTSSEFDVTVLRAEPEGEVVEGEGEAFGEG